MTVRFSAPTRAQVPQSDPRAPLTLGFLCPHNPYDRQSFSGTAFFAARALAARGDVSLKILGDHRPLQPTDRLRRRLFGQLPPLPDPARISLDGLDAVVGLVASRELDQLRHRLNIPWLHVTDATPAFLREAYGWAIPPQADAMETRIARAATTLVYSSDIMAARARCDLGAEFAARAIPFGVNLDKLPQDPPAKPPPDPIRLLFVCSDWDRKGGDLAVAALDRLRDAGWRAELTVVGKMPAAVRGHPGVIAAGYLNKNRAPEAARLAALYARAHLLLLPSRGDCTPMVVAEAMAHATPALVSDTGGVRSLVAQGTGRVLPATASAGDWADAIAELASAPRTLSDMSHAAFAHANQTLSWDGWAKRILETCRQAVTRRLAA